MSAARAIGVAPRFCPGGKLPAFDDDGLRERIEGRPLPQGGLYVVGAVGSHKTHLLAARAIDAKRRGYTAKLVNWSKFCIEVRSTYQRAATETELAILNRYADYEYLAIDDIGVGRDDRDESDHALRLAYVLLDDRYNDTTKTTDIATNSKPADMKARFDSRIARRIEETTTVYPMLLASQKREVA